MNADKNNNISRRHWFTASLRWAVLGSIALVSGRLLMRGQRSEQSCVDPKGYLGCGNCAVLKGCSLPRALSLKQFLRKDDEQRKS